MKKTKLKPKRKAKSINKTIKGKMKIKTKPPKEKKRIKIVSDAKFWGVVIIKRGRTYLA